MTAWCIEQHSFDVPTSATGYVRYERTIDGKEKVQGPYCDDCQVTACMDLRMRGDVSGGTVGAIPLNYREVRQEVKRLGWVERLRAEIESHPGAPDEVAEDIVKAILGAMEAYKVPGLSSHLSVLIDRWHAAQDDAAREALAEVDPESIF